MNQNQMRGWRFSAVLLFYGSVYFILDVAIMILHKNRCFNL